MRDRHLCRNRIENSTIANNVSTQAQSGLSGAGILLNGGDLTLTNSTIYNNSGVEYGGGIYARNSGKTITITNCTITNNAATNYDAYPIQVRRWNWC